MNTRATSLLSAACIAASVILLAAIVVAYAGRWDAVAALTLYPFWCWAISGMILAALAQALHRRRVVRVLFVAWPVAALAFADGVIPLFRAWQSDEPGPAGAVRVISLNCAGTPAAAREVLTHKPDLVLLQEVPGTNHVAALAEELFGTNACYVSGFDCAVVAPCPLEALRLREPYFTSALVHLGGQRVLVTSLRLVPPETRSDLWNPAAWRSYSENRRQRVTQLRNVLTALGARTEPSIVGGDFNAPGGDAAYRLLDGYHDAYDVAGRGWGHTALNDIPFVRPDQIWTRGLRPRSARAVKTVHSDHRMVVVDVEL